jgi:hypothetical protein
MHHQPRKFPHSMGLTGALGSPSTSSASGKSERLTMPSWRSAIPGRRFAPHSLLLSTSRFPYKNVAPIPPKAGRSSLGSERLSPGGGGPAQAGPGVDSCISWSTGELHGSWCSASKTCPVWDHAGPRGLQFSAPRGNAETGLRLARVPQGTIENSPGWKPGDHETQKGASPGGTTENPLGQ